MSTILFIAFEASTLQAFVEPWYNPVWLSLSRLQSFEWQNAEFLYGLFAIPFVALMTYWLQRRQQRISVALRVHVLQGFSFIAQLRHFPTLFFLAALAFVLLGLARPQRIHEEVERWTEGIDITLLMDISASMKIEDFSPNRLEASKRVAQDFITGRYEDRIGIVVFSGEAFSKAPLTTDYKFLHEQIEDIDFSLIESKGTAIGSALAVATNRLRESTSASKVLILLSDGDNTAGNIDPITSAKLADAYHIKIYTVAIGREGRVPYGRGPFGQQQYIENTLDETTLRQIAKIGKGKFYRVSDKDALEKVFREIDQLEKTEVKENRFQDTKEYYPIYLRWALACLVGFLFLKGTFMGNILRD